MFAECVCFFIFYKFTQLLCQTFWFIRSAYVNKRIFGDATKQHVVITGASDGIGRAIALQLASQGVSMILIARSRTKLLRTVEEAEKLGGKASIIVADLSQKIDFGTLLAGFEISMLINNAGICSSGPTPCMDDEMAADIVNVNLINTISLTQAVIRGKKRGSTVKQAFIEDGQNNGAQNPDGPISDDHSQKSRDSIKLGNINRFSECFQPKLQLSNNDTRYTKETPINSSKSGQKDPLFVLNIGSMTADHPMPFLATYAATKSALRSYTESIYHERSENLVVECVNTGFVCTKMSKIRRPSLFAPSATEYAKCVLSHFGSGGISFAYYPHLLQSFVLSLVPRTLIGYFMRLRQNRIRAHILKKQKT